MDSVQDGRCGEFGTARSRANARRHRVVPATVPWMAAQQPPRSQIGPTPGPESLDRLGGIGAAGRRVSAGRRKCRAYCAAIEADHGEQHSSRALHRAPTNSRARAESRSEPRRADGAAAASGNARTTVPEPVGSSAKRSASCARRRRLTWWRTTLLPTPLPTTSPTVAGVVSAVRPGEQMDDDAAATHARTATHDGREVTRPTHSVGGGQHLAANR